MNIRNMNRLYRKGISLVLALAMCCSPECPTKNGASFNYHMMIIDGKNRLFI